MTGGLFKFSTKPAGVTSEVVSLSVVKREKDTEINKSNLTKLISGVLGEDTQGPTKLELELIEELKAIAKQENGDFDEDDMCIYFGGDGAELAVYAFVEDNDDGDEDEPEQYTNYQAVLRRFAPNCFIAGEVKPTMKAAIQSVQSKNK
jgi:hypothetical protein